MIDMNYELKMNYLAKLYKENPLKYKFKLFFIVLLGYCYLLSVLFISFSIIGLFVYLSIINTDLLRIAIFLSIPLVFIILIIIKSLLIKVSKPSGIKLNAKEQPQLFAILKSLQKSMQTKKIHCVYLNANLNAGIMQYPKLGLLGMYRNYLIIGFPLMMAENETEFKAILAHELGHLSYNHGRFSIYIYRLQSTWNHFVRYFENNHSKLMWIFNQFINWYVPLFNSYAMALNREQENQADQLAASISSNEVYAQSLIKLDIASLIENKNFWKNIYEEAKNAITPPKDVYYQLYALYQNIDNTLIDKYHFQVINHKTSYLDTHPALIDRLKAIHINPDIHVNFNENCFSTLLNNDNSYLIYYNKLWFDRNIKWFNHTFKNTQSQLKRLQEIKLLDEEKFNLTDYFEKAFLIEHVISKEEALDMYNKILDVHKNYLPALFSKGRVLLSYDNSLGVLFIEEVIQKDMRYARDGYQLVINYFIFSNNSYEAQKRLVKLKEFNQYYEKATNERQRIQSNTKFIPHDLQEHELNEITTQLKNYSLIEYFYIARKKVKYLKQYSYYVICLKLKPVTVEKQKILINKIVQNIDFLGEIIIIPLNATLEMTMRNMKKNCD